MAELPIGDPDGRVFADPPVAAIEDDDFVLRRAAEQPVVAAFRNAFDQHFERAAHVAGGCFAATVRSADR